MTTQLDLFPPPEPRERMSGRKPAAQPPVSAFRGHFAGLAAIIAAHDRTEGGKARRTQISRHPAETPTEPAETT